MSEESPEVIKAKAEAAKMKYEARAQLHPVAQTIYALLDSLTYLITNVGCMIGLILIVLAFIFACLAPEVLSEMFGC